jgi:hypothetical protein
MIATVRRSKSNLGLCLTHIPRLNRASPQARGLVAWWPLSPCTGNAVPDVFSAAHGAAADLTWTVDAAFGVMPQFDGEREVCFSDAHLPAGVAPRSLCAWVKYNDAPSLGRTWGVLFYGTAGSNDRGLMIGAGSNSQWQPPGCLGMSQWGQSLVTPQAYNDSVWHHLVATFDGATWSIYVDGKLENVKPLQTLPTDTQPAAGRIGGLNFGPHYYWKGSIRDVRVYARALSAAEVWSLCNPTTRFDLWAPRRQPLAKVATADPVFLVGAGQVYVAGRNAGQIQLSGAAAGELMVAGAIIGEVK